MVEHSPKIVASEEKKHHHHHHHVCVLWVIDAMSGYVCEMPYSVADYSVAEATDEINSFQYDGFHKRKTSITVNM